MRESPVTFCPIPFDQQPVNEYEHLKETWLFSWAMLDLPAYSRKFAWLGFWGGVITCPIAAASFPPHKYPLLCGIATSLGAMAIMVLVLVRILLGWNYVRDRLQSEQIFYEESGWYDGQMWRKPTEMLARDRLIVSYQIDPLLHRLNRTGFTLGGAIILGWLLCLWL